MGKDDNDVNKNEHNPESNTGSDANSQEHVYKQVDVAKDTRSVLKKYWVLAAAVVVVLLGLVAYFLVYLPMTAPKAESEDESLSQATHFESAKVIVDKVSPNMKGVEVEIAEYSGLGGKTVDGDGVYGVPAHKVGDRKFSNLPEESFGAAKKGDSVLAAKNYNELVNFFALNKFKLVTSGTDGKGPISWNGDNVTFIKYATYESSNLVCMIWHADVSGTKIGDHLTSIGCGEKSSYEKAAKEADQYYTAYMVGVTGAKDNVVLGAPAVHDSTVSGYKYAVVFQEDPSELDVQFEGLYYKAPGQKDWKYFIGTHGWLDCPEFDSDAVKNAFAGFNCYDKVSDTIINVEPGGAVTSPSA